MELEGTFQGGMIVPDDASSFAEGERITLKKAAPESPQTFGERFAEFKGCLDGLPEDLAAQHDHYRLGTPKR